MSDSETINKISLIDLPELPKSVDNAIQNLSDLPTKEVGKTFSDIWFLVFGGISQAANKKRLQYAKDLELFEQELSDSISRIPTEKQIEPSIQVTAQALENSKYCIEEKELRQMFATLISNSMNSDFQNDIHPSFAEIIKQMTPMDANIIKVFKSSPITGLPLCQYQLSKNNGYKTLLDNVFLNYPEPNLPKIAVSISSLSRLGLLRTSYVEWISDEKHYLPFREHFWFKQLQQKFPHDNITFQKGIVALTPLGRTFTTVCIPD